MQTWSWTIPYTCLPDVGGINHLQWTLYSCQVPTFRSLNYTVAQKVSLGKDVGLSILLVVYQWLKFPTVNTVRFCDQVPLPRFFPRPKEKGSSYGSPSAQNTSLARTCRKVTLWPAPKKSGRDLPATYHHARTARIPSLSDIPIYGWIKHVPNHQPENQYPLEILFNTKP